MAQPCFTIFGQARTGSISGTVTDPSGAVLRGAQVSIGNKGITETTNQQGMFFRGDLPAGSYKLSVSYVGFKAPNETVKVAAGKTTTVNAALKLSSSVQSVIVSAPRAGGEAEAINTERSASTIEEVMPKKVIRSLPNANIADAVGRLPNVSLERDEGSGKYIQIRGTEPRFTNATIDGINLPSTESGVRQFKFNIIPADSVESIAVHKTLQADMEGDGIGGSVNLETKMPTDRPELSASAMGGYTPIVNRRGVTEETATFGKRFGTSKKLGLLLGGSYDYNGRGINDIEPAPDLAQAISYSTNGNGANKYNVSFGNPNLKAETGDDIDLLYDHYFKAFGMFSVGGFYKYLANPIIVKSFRLKNYQPPGGPLGNYFAQQPVNAGHAWVSGVEMSYIQHFTFLPGAWSGLGVNANWGHNWSRAYDIPGRSDRPPLLRTDPNSFNVTPTYDHGRLSVAAGLTYNQSSIQYYQYTDSLPGGVHGPLSDIYFYSHFQLDAQGSVNVGRGFRVVVSGLNLNNEVFGFYQGSLAAVARAARLPDQSRFQGGSGNRRLGS